MLDTGYPKAAMPISLSIEAGSAGCCKSDGARRDIQELSRGGFFIRVNPIFLRGLTMGYTSWLNGFNYKVTRVLLKVWFIE